MVKPPRRMEPESVELSKAGRSSAKAFHEDSFAKYMARKIDGQRRVKGYVAPPDPVELQKSRENEVDLLESVREVRFTADTVVKKPDRPLKRRRRREVGMEDLVKRLKEQHGQGYSERFKSREAMVRVIASALPESEMAEETWGPTNDPSERMQDDRTKAPDTSDVTNETITKRPDLFFHGVVVLVNGYTNPDLETIHRLLHKHGGDLEKYETSRVTHIIAENLSAAKANVYKNQVQPKPVCQPAWIVDSVAARRLLPYRNYLLEDVKKGEISSIRPIMSFLSKQVKNDKHVDSKLMQGNLYDCAMSESCEASDSAANERDQGINEHSDPNHKSTGHPATPAETYNVCGATETVYPLRDANVSGRELDMVVEAPTGCSKNGRTDEKYINGRIRTIGTDPDFLESFFNSSRLSFIGSYKQRVKNSPTKRTDLTLKNKRRFVMHVDMDSFFCSVVLRNFPQYRDKPVVISHHGKRKTDVGSREAIIQADSTSECATCNYEARKYGIKKGMFLGRAKQLCPALVVLHYDFEGFEEVSEQVAEILHRHAAQFSGSVEQVSCDESYVEFLLPINGAELLRIEEIGREIRREIYEETQCTATVGISINKLLAKLATDKVKPDGLLSAFDHEDLLKDLRLRDLPGIGYRLEAKLAAEGFETVKDVWARSKVELISILGKGTGAKLFNLCYGNDDRPVEPAERKSIGAECNYGVRFNGPYGPDHALTCLAKEVNKRMATVSVKGVKITLKVKVRKEGAPPPPKFLGHGSCHNLSKSRDVPDGRPTRENAVIRDVCVDLYKEMALKKEDVRGIGIVVTKLTTDDAHVHEGQGEGNDLSDFFTKLGTKRVLETELTDADTEQGKISEYLTEANNGDRGVSIPGGEPSTFVVKDHTEEDIDIELPSLSQIHMSQVNQLPSPLRRNAMRQIKSARLAHEKRLKQRMVEGIKSRWKQTNVERLFKLVAVKNGEAPLHGISGGQVSLRELESLPLEMQLQLANNDNCSVGVIEKPKKNSKQSATSHMVSRSSRPGTSSSLVAPVDAAVAKNDGLGEDLPLFENTDPDVFFQDNLFPLSIFLDENQPNHGNISCVVDFFGACIMEDRLHELSLMLRSVKNREDEWKGRPFDQILDRVDDLLRRQLNRKLDRQWLEKI